jgi:hypothetical protein
VCIDNGQPHEARCADLHAHPVGRRALLTTGAVGAGALALDFAVGTPAQADPTPSTVDWRPDPDSPRFTLVVMPDTQFLFDQDRIHPAPLDASLRWILAHAREENIVFLAHLGDLTENGQAGEFDAIGRSFQVLDRAGAGYSVLAGNHDINSSTNDQRGDTPYLRAFGPARFAHAGTFAGASPDGYNTAHLFRAGGRRWLVLALDWRPSSGGIAWARSVRFLLSGR